MEWRNAVGAILALALVAIPVAEAGKKKKKPVEPVPEPVVEVPATPPEVFPWAGWQPGFDHGGVPEGLATASAQGCNACHYEAHDQWSASAHATPPSTAFLEVANATSPACTSCHLPLARQQPLVIAWDGDDINLPVTDANAHWDATLATEGVTCAACHIREATVVGGTAPAAAPAAHPKLAWSSQLGSSEGCASCHQLSWPGADRPLYDTFGEWERSAYAQAGVGCVDCHMPNGHTLIASPERAFTVLVDLAAPTATRGTAISAGISLINTGAGHAMPSGSPWSELELRIALEHTGDKPRTESETRVVFGQTLSTEPPWSVTEDSRLKPGEAHDVDWTGLIPADAPAAPWFLMVQLIERGPGESPGTSVLERKIALQVD